MEIHWYLAQNLRFTDLNDEGKAPETPAEKDLIATGTTDDTGKVKFKLNGAETEESDMLELFWFKEYVIKETKSATGYVLEDAAAQGDSNVEVTQNNDNTAEWVLHIPNQNAGKEDAHQTVTVTNVREMEVNLKARKTLTGNDLKAGAYEFQLLDSEKKVLQTKGNDVNGDVTFDPVDLTRVATETNPYTFYIKEILPEDPENEGAVLNEKDGVTYDDTVYTVTVTTKWEDNTLKVDKITYSVNGVESSSGAQFTNHYEAIGTWQLTGTKNLTGRYQKDKEFTFNLVETDQDGNPLKNG